MVGVFGNFKLLCKCVVLNFSRKENRRAVFVVVAYRVLVYVIVSVQVAVCRDESIEVESVAEPVAPEAEGVSFFFGTCGSRNSHTGANSLICVRFSVARIFIEVYVVILIVSAATAACCSAGNNGFFVFKERCRRVFGEFYERRIGTVVVEVNRAVVIEDKYAVSYRYGSEGYDAFTAAGYDSSENRYAREVEVACAYAVSDNEVAVYRYVFKMYAGASDYYGAYGRYVGMVSCRSDIRLEHIVEELCYFSSCDVFQRLEGAVRITVYVSVFNESRDISLSPRRNVAGIRKLIDYGNVSARYAENSCDCNENFLSRYLVFGAERRLAGTVERAHIICFCYVVVEPVGFLDVGIA